MNNADNLNTVVNGAIYYYKILDRNTADARGKIRTWAPASRMLSQGLETPLELLIQE